jgi:glycosyltransferase involved in cell wall biosynthesis
MTRPRITHVTAVPATGEGPVGGVGAYSLNLFALLANAPFDYAVVCNRDADRGKLATLAPAVDVLPAWRFDGFDVPWTISRAVDASQPRIVHVQQELFLYGRGAKALLFPLLLRRLQRKHTVVVTVHGVVTAREIDEQMLAGRRSPIPLPIVRRIIVGIFTAIARSRAHLVVHSETLGDRLVELGARPTDVTVIPLPLYAKAGSGPVLTKAQARAKLDIPEGAHVILTWGYWNGYKGLDVLTEGFKRYRATDPRALLVLGTGPHPQLRNDPAYVSTYDEAMKALSDAPNIRHAGFIPDDELDDYLAAADVSVFAYTKHLAASGPGTYAISRGAPTLLSTVFADAPSGITFAPNAPALAEALARFFANPAAHTVAADALRDQASDANIVAAYAGLYAKLLTQ